jgi:hypothetical protein
MSSTNWALPSIRDTSPETSAARHWVLSAPGGFDRFFMDCADVFAAPEPLDFSRLTAINAKYGNRLV